MARRDQRRDTTGTARPRSAQRPTPQAPDGRRRRPAQEGTRPAGEAPRRRAQHAAPSRSHAAAPRRRSSAPLIIALLVLLALIGVGVFFLVRSCSSSQVGAGSGGSGTVEATEEEAAPEPTRINLMMVGDILFHYQVRMSGLQDDGSRNYDHLFAHITSELEGQDLKVLNQETPLGGPVYQGTAPDGYDGYPEFNGPQEVADAEVKAGFNVVLKATNHAMDNSGNFDDPYTLVRSEQNYWADNYPQVAVIGEANPDVEGSSPYNVFVFEKDGFRVALLNFTQDLNGNESHDQLGMVSMLEESMVRQVMANAREEADMIVVFPHWGEEYSTEPIEEQRAWADLFVEEGADVIIGNHPHVIEPVTVLHGDDGRAVPCFWSTGNFVSTSPSDESLVGGIAKVTLMKDPDGACSVEAASFTPIVTHLGLADDMTTYLLSDWTDELAATNWLNTDINPSTDNTTLTPAWANEFCTRVLGDDFDTTREVLDLDVSPAQPRATEEGGEGSSLLVTTDGERA